MKIGFDIDGVLANFLDSFLVEYINPNFKMDYKQECMTDFVVYKNFSGMTPEQEAEWFNHARDNEIFVRLKPYNDILALINTLRKDGHEIYYITHRSKRAIEQTYKWFMKYNIPMGHGIYFTPMTRNPTKGEMAQYLGLDIFIDDCYDNCLGMINNIPHVWLLDRPINRKYQDCEQNNIHRIYSSQHFYDEVRKLCASQ